MPDDLKLLQERPGFQILTSEEAAVLIGLILFGLAMWDIVARALEFFRG